MKSNTVIGIAFVTGALLCIGALPSRAQSSLSFTLVDIESESESIDISTNGGSSYDSALAGRYRGSFAEGPQDINIFCTDVNHETDLGSTYMVDSSHKITDSAGPLSGRSYAGGLSSAIVAGDYGATFAPGTLTATQRSSEVAWLADNYLSADANTFHSGVSGSTGLNDNLSAISLSIWDIVQDGGDGITNGQFRVDNKGQIKIDNLVSYYQSQASLHRDYLSGDATWVQSLRDPTGIHGQDYVTNVGRGKPIPEPETLLLLGCAAPALALIWRRRVSIHSL